MNDKNKNWENFTLADWRNAWHEQREATGQAWWEGYYRGMVIVLSRLPTLTPTQYALLTKLQVLLASKSWISKTDKIHHHEFMTPENRAVVVRSLKDYL